MPHFSPDYLEFFKELAPNNHKVWMDANRQRYLKTIKDPFYNFVDELIPEIAKIDQINYELTAKDCVFRVNRDIRFAKDKSPYKLKMSAIISPGGKKNKSYPGIYFEMGPEDFRIYGGLYSLDKEQIYDMRQLIVSNLMQFNQLISEKTFKTAYGEILGEKNKIIPKEFKEAAGKQALILNKNWYFFKTFDPEIILQPNLKKIILDHYKIAKPVKDFFVKGIKSN